MTNDLPLPEGVGACIGILITRAPSSIVAVGVVTLEAVDLATDLVTGFFIYVLCLCLC